MRYWEQHGNPSHRLLVNIPLFLKVQPLSLSLCLSLSSTISPSNFIFLCVLLRHKHLHQRSCKCQKAVKKMEKGTSSIDIHTYTYIYISTSICTHACIHSSARIINKLEFEFPQSGFKCRLLAAIVSSVLLRRRQSFRQGGIPSSCRVH